MESQKKSELENEGKATELESFDDNQINEMDEAEKEKHEKSKDKSKAKKEKEKEKGLTEMTEAKELESLTKSKDKSKKLLISAEDYKKAAVIVGTKVITGYMEKYVYKRRADGLAIIDVEKTDEKIQAAINFLSQFKPEDILVFCKREAGWEVGKKFQEVTGTKVYVRRYPAGVITNYSLPNFFEPKILLTVDPWIDKNAINDAVKIGIPIISLCDTNNVTNKLDLVIPCNNKTRTSIGLIFYLIAKGYTKEKGLPFKAKPEDFTGEEGEGEEVNSKSRS